MGIASVKCVCRECCPFIECPNDATQEDFLCNNCRGIRTDIERFAKHCHMDDSEAVSNNIVQRMLDEFQKFADRMKQNESE